MCNCKQNACFDGFLTSADIRTGFISGVGFKNKPVQYAAVDGMAVFEGCIVLGTVEAMEQHTEAVRAAANSDAEAVLEEIEISPLGLVLPGEQYRWPGGIVPYAVDPNLPNQNRVTEAIAHWQAKTHIRFVLRTNSNADKYRNYIYFRPADGCWSYVGMRGGQQDIGLANGCGTGATIHEIGHALGLWHEQSREDRDRHIRIHWQNIDPQQHHNFNQHITDGDDVGYYDYDSIMHYGPTAFSINGQPTITTLSGKPIGQRGGLSEGDVATIKAIYPQTGPGPQSRPYTVRQGDWLFTIAQRELGDGNRWREIMKTPNGGFFNEAEAQNLQVGQVIYLPLR